MLKVYEVRQNSDLTEGRGQMLRKATFTNDGAALTFIEESLHVDMGGRKSAEIIEVIVYDTTTERKEHIADHPQPVGSNRVWGYRKDWRGKWGEGWLDNRDAPVNDPEYAEYQRLRKKFHDD